MTSAKKPLFLFTVGPKELRVLLGWRRGRLLGPFRDLDAATRGRRHVICGPDLHADARAAGLAHGPLPPDAVKARAIFAAFTLWQALVSSSPPPGAIRALLDAARTLHRRWPGSPGAWTLVIDDRRWRVRLEGTPERCTRLAASCEHAPFELELRLDDGPAFAAAALADAGWPVVPLPLARVGAQRRPLDLDDLIALTRIARSVAYRLPARPGIAEEHASYAALPPRLLERFADLPEVIALARALVQARTAEDPEVAEAFQASIDALLARQGPLRALAVEEAMALRLRVPRQGTLEARIEERLAAAVRAARSPPEVQGAIAALIELDCGGLVADVEELACDVLEELEGTPAFGVEAAASYP